MKLIPGLHATMMEAAFEFREATGSQPIYALSNVAMHVKRRLFDCLLYNIIAAK